MRVIISSQVIANNGIRFGVGEHSPVSGEQCIIEDDLTDPCTLMLPFNKTRQNKTLAEGFYMDDLLTSQPTEEEALSLIYTDFS